MPSRNPSSLSEGLEIENIMHWVFKSYNYVVKLSRKLYLLLCTFTGINDTKTANLFPSLAQSCKIKNQNFKNKIIYYYAAAMAILYCLLHTGAATPGSVDSKWDKIDKEL